MGMELVGSPIETVTRRGGCNRHVSTDPRGRSIGTRRYKALGNVSEFVEHFRPAGARASNSDLGVVLLLDRKSVWCGELGRLTFHSK